MMQLADIDRLGCSFYMDGCLGNNYVIMGAIYFA